MRALIIGLLAGCALSTPALADWYCPELEPSYRVYLTDTFAVFELPNELIAYHRVEMNDGPEQLVGSDGETALKVEWKPDGFDTVSSNLERISHSKCALQ